MTSCGPRGRGDRDRRPEVLLGSAERSRGYWTKDEGASIEKQGREFTPTLPTDENPREIRLRARLGSQPLQSRSPPKHLATIQGPTLRCHG